MILRISILVVLAIGLALIARGVNAAQPVQRYALIASTNRAPEANMRPLQYADDDAVQYYEIFRRAAQETVLLTVMDSDTQQRFGDVAGHTRPLTTENLKSALDALFDAIEKAKAGGAETELYFIYSGHGRLLPGLEGAITLDDGELTRQDLYQMLLERSPADFNHLIIDACDAYYMVHSKGEEGEWRDDRSGRQREEVRTFFDALDLSRFPNTGVLLSTSKEAETHEWSLYRGGVFSHEVRSGLLGAADITEDGYIEYSELQAFVRAANHRIDDPLAKLDIHAEAPRQDARRPLFDLMSLRDARLLDIPKTMRGRFYLEDARGTRLADFNKSDEQSLTIALFADKTYFLREQDDAVEFEIEPGDGRRTSLAALRSRPFDAAAKGAVETSFRADLFTQPFGQGFYSGVVEGLKMVPAKKVGRPGWIAPEEMHAVSVDITRESMDLNRDWKRPAAWTGLAVGVGALAGAGALTYFAADSAAAFRTSMTRDDAYLRRQHAYTYSAIGAYSLSALAFGLSIYWFVTAEDASAPRGGRPGNRLIGRVRPAGVLTKERVFLGIEGAF